MKNGWYKKAVESLNWSNELDIDDVVKKGTDNKQYRVCAIKFLYTNSPKASYYVCQNIKTGKLSMEDVNDLVLISSGGFKMKDYVKYSQGDKVAFVGEDPTDVSRTSKVSGQLEVEGLYIRKFRDEVEVGYTVRGTDILGVMVKKDVQQDEIEKI